MKVVCNNTFITKVALTMWVTYKCYWIQDIDVKRSDTYSLQIKCLNLEKNHSWVPSGNVYAGILTIYLETPPISTINRLISPSKPSYRSHNEFRFVAQVYLWKYVIPKFGYRTSHRNIDVSHQRDFRMPLNEPTENCLWLQVLQNPSKS